MSLVLLRATPVCGPLCAQTGARERRPQRTTTALHKHGVSSRAGMRESRTTEIRSRSAIVDKVAGA